MGKRNEKVVFEDSESYRKMRMLQGKDGELVRKMFAYVEMMPMNKVEHEALRLQIIEQVYEEKTNDKNFYINHKNHWRKFCNQMSSSFLNKPIPKGQLRMFSISRFFSFMGTLSIALLIIILLITISSFLSFQGAFSAVLSDQQERMTLLKLGVNMILTIVMIILYIKMGEYGKKYSFSPNKIRVCIVLGIALLLTDVVNVLRNLLTGELSNQTMGISHRAFIGILVSSLVFGAAIILIHLLYIIFAVQIYQQK